MSYVVRIRDNETSEIRSHKMDHEWVKHWGTDLTWWTEGNFSCDCNRALVWKWAVGIDTDLEDDDLDPCGHTHYTVIDATLPDGTVIPIDSSVPSNIPKLSE